MGGADGAEHSCSLSLAPASLLPPAARSGDLQTHGIQKSFYHNNTLNILEQLLTREFLLAVFDSYLTCEHRQGVNNCTATKELPKKETEQKLELD